MPDFVSYGKITISETSERDTACRLRKPIYHDCGQYIGKSLQHHGQRSPVTRAIGIRGRQTYQDRGHHCCGIVSNSERDQVLIVAPTL